MYTKKQLTQGLRYQLSHDRNKARQALVFLYNAQTDEEQARQETVEHNEVGFTALDAEILSGIARFYLEHKFLTPKQDAIVRKLVPKYTSQILTSSIERGLIVRRSRQRWEILDKERKV